MASDSFSTSEMRSGMRMISSTRPIPSSRESLRVRPSFRAVISRAVTWAVNAFVDATEISGPACR